MENLNACLKFCTDVGKIKLVNIGSSDINKGNKTIILGLIWSIILFWSLKGSGSGAKKVILGWIKGDGNDPVLGKVKNFTSSWSDGVLLNAILARERPDLNIDMDKVQEEDPITNLNSAFDIIDDELGVPKLLDAEDVHNNPDDKSMQTYIGEVYNVLHRNDDEQVGETQDLQFSEITTDSFRCHFKLEDGSLIVPEKQIAVDYVNGLVIEYIPHNDNKKDKYKKCKKEVIENFKDHEDGYIDITDLKEGELYDVRYYGLNASKVKSAKSQTKPVQLIPNFVAPVIVEDINDKSCTIKWDKHELAVKYELHIEETSGAQDEIIETFEVTDDGNHPTSYEFDQMLLGKTYNADVKVIMKNDKEIGPSDKVDFEPVIGKANQPEIIDNTNTTAHIKWDPVDDALGYIVEINDEGDDTDKNIIDEQFENDDDLVHHDGYDRVVKCGPEQTELVINDLSEDDKPVKFRVIAMLPTGDDENPKINSQPSDDVILDCEGDSVHKEKAEKTRGKVAFITSGSSPKSISIIKDLLSQGNNIFSWSSGFKKIYILTDETLTESLKKLKDNDDKNVLQYITFNPLNKDSIEEARQTISTIDYIDVTINNGKLKADQLISLIGA